MHNPGAFLGPLDLDICLSVRLSDMEGPYEVTKSKFSSAGV